MAKSPTKVITGPNTLWSYVHVFQPNSINGSTPKYSVALIFRKDSPDIPKIRAAIQAAYDEGIAKLKSSSSAPFVWRRSGRTRFRNGST